MRCFIDLVWHFPLVVFKFYLQLNETGLLNCSLFFILLFRGSYGAPLFVHRRPRIPLWYVAFLPQSFGHAWYLPLPWTPRPWHHVLPEPGSTWPLVHHLAFFHQLSRQVPLLLRPANFAHTPALASRTYLTNHFFWVNYSVRYLKVPLFSFPHDLQCVSTCDLCKVVLYEREVCNYWLIHCLIIHGLGVAPGCIRHGDDRTWPWNGERKVSWGPHSKVVRLRLITCILSGQPPMLLYNGDRPQTGKHSDLFWTNAAR